jgi:hypothetical protein
VFDFIKPAIKKYPAEMAMFHKVIEQSLKDPVKRVTLKQTSGTRTYIPFDFKGDIINPMLTGALKQLFPEYKEITTQYSTSSDVTYIYFYLD